MPVFGVFQVRIQSESGEIQARKSPNTDTFHTMSLKKKKMKVIIVIIIIMTIMANGVFRQDRFSKHEKAHKALRIFLHFLIES